MEDLKIIEGIGPKIEELLNREGIHTIEQLADTSIIRLAAVLKKAGPRFQIQNPTSWPKQALLAKDQKWDELEQLKRLIMSNKEF
ncbi:helix-hairpin-helix domain-containing protein [Dyadobacter alkalitolerans]|uniref:helix-hairpin-helix domain-containing protein n=1 Tax=Dyadobacter alkalitolerans TaxID=492736 RepID=UPI00041C5132|nr:helix-hairpin-helix domain-containing protein [Dyadobacter alkalitolerans]